MLKNTQKLVKHLRRKFSYSSSFINQYKKLKTNQKIIKNKGKIKKVLKPSKKLNSYFSTNQKFKLNLEAINIKKKIEKILEEINSEKITKIETKKKNNKKIHRKINTKNSNQKIIKNPKKPKNQTLKKQKKNFTYSSITPNLPNDTLPIYFKHKSTIPKIKTLQKKQKISLTLLPLSPLIFFLTPFYLYPLYNLAFLPLIFSIKYSVEFFYLKNSILSVSLNLKEKKLFFGLYDSKKFLKWIEIDRTRLRVVRIEKKGDLNRRNHQDSFDLEFFSKGGEFFEKTLFLSCNQKICEFVDFEFVNEIWGN